MKKIVSLGTAAALLMAFFATTTVATAKTFDNCTNVDAIYQKKKTGRKNKFLNDGHDTGTSDSCN